MGKIKESFEEAGDKIRDVVEKIGDYFEVDMPFWLKDTRNQVATVVFDVLIGGAVVSGLGMCGVSAYVADKKIDANKEVEKLHNAFNIVIQEELENNGTTIVAANTFNAMSGAVYNFEDDCKVVITGHVEAANNSGKQYSNVSFKMSKEQVEELLNKMNIKTNEKIDFDAAKDYKIKSLEDVEAYKQACTELYAAFTTAIQNAESLECELVGSTETFDLQADKLDKKKQEEKIKSISSVYSDEKHNNSFFFIITQNNKNEMVQYRVEVEGAEKTPDQVYAEFIQGKYKAFVNVTQERQENMVSLNR